MFRQLVNFRHLSYLRSMSTLSREKIIAQVKRTVPKLSNDLYKGQCGKVAIMGGSFEYTGAPVFAGWGSFRTGADLVYIFCSVDAGTPIKSSNPDFIVLPIVPHTEEKLNEGYENISTWMKPLDALVIGPGLGRNDIMLKCALYAMAQARKADIPVIVDGDGLFALNTDLDVLKGYKKAILTPNVVEFGRLHEKVLGTEIRDGEASLRELAKKLDGVTIVKKGSSDMICNGDELISCDIQGSYRRCGGQGDVLAGTIGTFAAWNFGKLKGHEKLKREVPDCLSPTILASYAGCLMTRYTSRKGYEKYKRSMVTQDMLNLIGDSFIELFEDIE